MLNTGYHSNSGPRRGVVLTGMDARVPARLKDVNDGLHADVELGHPHHPEPALRVLHETHLSARLQGNTYTGRHTLSMICLLEPTDSKLLSMLYPGQQDIL